MSQDLGPNPTGRRPPAPEEPFDRLFLAEYGKVVAVAHRVLADRSEAEDVAQEVFLDFHRKQRPDAAYAAGVRYVDAARSYGLAEEFLAGWLAERGRELSAVELDWMLWEISQSLYPVRPYHRTRTIFY